MQHNALSSLAIILPALLTVAATPYADQTNGCDLIAKTCPSSEYHQAYMTCMCSNWKMLSGSNNCVQGCVNQLKESGMGDPQTNAQVCAKRCPVGSCGHIPSDCAWP